MTDKVKLISDGSLLFPDNHPSAIEAILHKIAVQMEKLCTEKNDATFYRIDWRILYGEKFGND